MGEPPEFVQEPRKSLYKRFLAASLTTRVVVSFLIVVIVPSLVTSVWKSMGATTRHDIAVCASIDRLNEIIAAATPGGDPEAFQRFKDVLDQMSRDSKGASPSIESAMARLAKIRYSVDVDEAVDEAKEFTAGLQGLLDACNAEHPRNP